jgi:hypothetical protein
VRQRQLGKHPSQRPAARALVSDEIPAVHHHVLEQFEGFGRGERVRTYNFPQSRVTDHRVGVTVHDAEAMMRGEELDAIVDALLEAEQGELLERLVEEALAAAAKAGKAA